MDTHGPLAEAFVARSSAGTQIGLDQSSHHHDVTKMLSVLDLIMCIIAVVADFHSALQVAGVDISAFYNVNHRCPAGEFYYISSGYRKVPLSSPLSGLKTHLDLTSPRFRVTRASTGCSADALSCPAAQGGACKYIFVRCPRCMCVCVWICVCVCVCVSMFERVRE